MKTEKNTILYIRLHKDIVLALEQESERTNKKKATLVSEILIDYVKKLEKRVDIFSASSSDMNFSNNAFKYVLYRGRTQESSAGKPMRITIPVSINNSINILADNLELSPQTLRAAIITTQLYKKKKASPW